MATFLTSGENNDNTSGTTLDTAATMSVTSGSCIVGWVKWEGTNGATPSIAKNDATNSFTMVATTDHSNGDLHSAWGYLLTHGMSGATTFRFTLSAARTFRRIILMEFSYSGTASFDNATTNILVGSVSVTSGNMTVSSNAQVVCGGYGEYSLDTTSGEQINGVAADGKVTTGGITTMWRRVISAGFTGAATANNITSSDHLVGIISINVASSITTEYVGPIYGSQRGNIMIGRRYV